MANYYRDIHIAKGTDYEEVIDISVPFSEYDFEGYIKSSYASTVGVPFVFTEVIGKPKKLQISLSAEVTATLPRRRGVYDIFIIHKQTSEKTKERMGIAHYTQSVSFVAPEPPPPGYQVHLEDILGVGSAAASNTEDFATAEQGEKADTALQTEPVNVADQTTRLALTSEEARNRIIVQDDTSNAYVLVNDGDPSDANDWRKISSSLVSYLDQIATLLDYPTEFSPASHTHSLNDITNSEAVINDTVRWNGTAWVPFNDNIIRRYDASFGTTYYGKAPEGSLETDEVWTISAFSVNPDGTLDNMQTVNNTRWSLRYTVFP